MNRAVVAIGSNIEPEANLPAAMGRLAEQFGLLASTRPVRTTPIDRPEQADYLNAAALVETPLDRPRMKRKLREIEARLHRVRSADKWASRTIDLDIVVWNGQIVDEAVRTRPFLTAAVRELCPEAIL